MTKTTTSATARISNRIADEAANLGQQVTPAKARAASEGPTDSQTLGPLTPSSIVAQLWEAAAPNLTREELKWFASAGSQAFESAQHLSHVMAGVGCLMAEDSAKGRIGAGSFRDGEDALNLLAALSDALDGISSMMYVAHAAAADLIWGPTKP